MTFLTTIFLPAISALFLLRLAEEENPAEPEADEDRDQIIRSLRTKMQNLEDRINRALKDVSDQKDKSSRKLKRKIEKQKLELQKARLELEEKLENMKDSSEQFWNKTKRKMLDNWEKLDSKVKKMLS